MIRDPRPNVPPSHGWWEGDQNQVGAFLHAYDSLWLPASLLQKDQRRRLAEALFAASRYHRIELHFNKGIAGAPEQAVAATRATATNPAVEDAFVLAIVANGERPAYPGLSRPAMDMVVARQRAKDVALAAAELRKIAPDAGSYVSESNYFNVSWQKAYSQHPGRLALLLSRSSGNTSFDDSWLCLAKTLSGPEIAQSRPPVISFTVSLLRSEPELAESFDSALRRRTSSCGSKRPKGTRRL